MLRHRAVAQPLQLRKDKPHPVRTLAPRPQLGQRAGVTVGLGLHEAVELEGIAWHVTALYRHASTELLLSVKPCVSHKSVI